MPNSEDFGGPESRTASYTFPLICETTPGQECYLGDANLVQRELAGGFWPFIVVIRSLVFADFDTTMMVSNEALAVSTARQQSGLLQPSVPDVESFWSTW